MWREARLVAGKDLRVEFRSRVVLNQVIPFAAVVVLLFAFALDPDAGVLRTFAPGLFWVAVLLSSLIVLQRSFAMESVDGGRDGLRVAGLDPAAIFLGKGVAVAVMLLGLEAALAVGVVVLYDAPFASGWLLLCVTCVAATLGLVAPGIIFGALASGVRVRETLLPLLFLPVVAPVMIGATQAFEAAIDPTIDNSVGWRWCGLIGVFAGVYVALGLVVFEPLLEDS